MKTPLVIIHRHSKTTDNKEHLVLLCSKALHMNKGETKLLCYYANQTSGFRPSAQHIASITNMSRRIIFYAREALIEHGIAQIEDNKILIYWNRIRLFSTLDPKMTGKKFSIKPMKNDSKRFTTELLNFLMFGRQEEVCKFFSNITEEQYDYIKTKLHYNGSPFFNDLK